MKTLLIRQDKIGDLIATLPVDQHIPSACIWVVAEEHKTLIEHLSQPRNVFFIPQKFSWKAFLSFIRFIKSENPAMSILFYAKPWVYWACFIARIPKRVGRLSQWQSFLTLNNGLRQQRSLSEKHEALYNLDLINHALGTQHKDVPYLELRAPLLRNLLEKYQVQKLSYYVVHPGMAGSALNWPTEYYAELIKKLSLQLPVLITGTEKDKKYLDPLRPLFKNFKNVLWLENQLGFKELLYILSQSKAVIAPSTGVLHLAASLNVSCLGLYSPVRAHHPIRWGPRGPKAKYLVPESKIASVEVCIKQSCKQFPCMHEITPEKVLHTLKT